MDNDGPVQTNDWKNTKQAVANFRRLLLCSKCSNVMKEPVCLGMCEHILCRSCAGPRAGEGCVVCHSPAWVKDIQINRQLSSIIELFSGLESLLHPTGETVKTQTPPESSVLKHKKNLKIWFSPRSRKVRCMVEKPSNDTIMESRSSSMPPNANSAQLEDLSVFNFTQSSQDSGSPCVQKCKKENGIQKKRATKKNATSRKMSTQRDAKTKQIQTKEMTSKSRLEAINQHWGITEDVDSINEKEQPRAESAGRSNKRVSFQSPAVTSDEPQQEIRQESTYGPGASTMGSSPSEDNTVPNDQTHSGQNMTKSVMQHDKLSPHDPSSNDSPSKHNNVSPIEHPSKRYQVDEKVTALETTPKRPKASPIGRRKSLMSPAVLNMPSPDSSRSDKNMRNLRQERGECTPVRATISPKSPHTRAISVGQSPSASPIMKRNHKGETPLHVASIKGDVEAVKDLLNQGADPNLKDNAGWTPLHEACNLGHLAVVEVLVSGGALLNTPGYENDAPLHDAVRNGHPAIVKRLLQLGASQNVLNLHGKQPADYAASLEMLEIFQEASEATQCVNISPGPSASLSVVRDSVRTDEIVVLLASKLLPSEQDQLAQLGELLGGRMADTFSGSVSHIVLPEGPTPTTFSTLIGLLAGCWLVKFSWVKACLQAGKWMPEAEHEAGEGPQRSRINRCSLLPPLFDGCFFFLHGSFMSPPKDELTKLLREGGGQLLSRKPKPDSDVTQTLSAAAYHALPGSDQALCTQYIIFDPQGPHRLPVVRRGKVWSAPSSWIISCITAFRLLPVQEPQTSV